jgi:hypothetical protein
LFCKGCGTLVLDFGRFEILYAISDSFDILPGLKAGDSYGAQAGY